MRAVFDPGALVSGALTPHGICRRLLTAALQGQFEMAASEQLMAELREVLRRPKFARYLTARDVQVYLALVHVAATHYPDPVVAHGLTPDPDDDYLVALARATNADYLVSGDQHLLGLHEPQPPVLPPRAFWDVLNSQASTPD